MKPIIPLFLILTLLAIGSFPKAKAISADSFLIGFSPFSLFNAEEGVPIFKRGENLWVYSKILFIVSLVDPSGKVVVSNQRVSDTLVKLYEFSKDDKLGEWKLVLTSATRLGRFTLPLYVLEPKLEVISSTNSFNLIQEKINFQGSIQVKNFKNITSVEVLLVKKGISNSTKEVDTGINLDGNRLFVKMNYDSARGIIKLFPYLQTLPSEGAIEGIFWAEIIQEYPIIKKGADESFVLIYKKVPIIQSDKERFKLSTITNNTLALIVPRIFPSSALVGELAPLRQGIGYIRLYVEKDNNLRYFDKKLYFIKGLNGLEIVEINEVQPSKGKIDYSLTGNLSGSTDYELVLIAKIFGLDSFLRETISPTIARVKLMNSITGQYVSDFSLSLSKNLSYSKVADTVYVVLPKESFKTEYSVNFRGINLDKDSLEPKILELKGNYESIIKFKAGVLSIKAEYNDGSKVNFANVEVFRLNGKVEEGFTDTLTNGNLNLTLPFGLYRVSLDVGGNVKSHKIYINSTNQGLNLYFEKPIIEQITPQSENLQYYLFIIIAEVITCAYVWKRALRRLNSNA
ncbi:MAG: hypothetical protein QXX95_06245 [Nitrososphaerales archaeon]